MKNAIILHGYNGIPKVNRWLEKELQKLNYSVIMPEFPIQEKLSYENYEKILDIYKDKFNQETIVVAHSGGNEAIIKYLSKNSIKMKLYIGLAGFAEVFENEGRDDLNRAVKDLLVSNNEVSKFKELVSKRYAIYSDNDHVVPFEVLERYPKIIDAVPILIKGVGHMGRKSGTENMPEILEIIRGVSNENN